MTDKIDGVPRELLEKLQRCADFLRFDGMADAADQTDALLREAAQPEQVLDESVRKSWGRFSDALLRGPDVPLPGMIEAFERHYSQDFRDKDWRVESSTWASAWKACLATTSHTDEELRMSCPMQDQSNCALFSGGRAEAAQPHPLAELVAGMQEPDADMRRATAAALQQIYDEAPTVAGPADEELRRDADPSLLSDTREIVAVLSGEFEEYHGEEDEIGRDLLRRLDAAIAAEKREGS